MQEKLPKPSSGERASSEVSGIREKIPTDKQVFGFAESEHRIAERYAPVFLAQGGEHLVYEIPGRADIVVKANKVVMHTILTTDPEASGKDRVEESPALREAELGLKRDQVTYASLREHFGATHVPAQKRYLVRVPVTTELLKGVDRRLKEVSRKFTGHMPDVPEAWTTISVQRKLELPEEGTLCPRSGNIEVKMMKTNLVQDEHSVFEYERVTDKLLDGALHPDLTTQDILEYAGSKELRMFALHVREDAEFREVVKDFLSRAVAFSEATGEILDVFGENNVVFFEEDGHWTYKLIDPLYPFDTGVLEHGRKAYQSGEDFYKMATRDSKALQSAVRFTRLLNGVAALVNLEELKKPEAERAYAATLPFLPKGQFKGGLAERFFPPILGLAA